MVDLTNSILSRPIQPVGGPPKQTPALKAGESSFQDILRQSIAKVNQMQEHADGEIERLVTGKTDNVVEVMSAVEKADIAFRQLMAIRNKLVAAFEEIRRVR